MRLQTVAIYALVLFPTDTIDVHNGWNVVQLLYSMAQVECTAEALKAAHIDISDFIDGYYLAALDYEKG